MTGAAYEFEVPEDLTNCDVTMQMFVNISTGGVCELQIIPYGKISIRSHAQIYGLSGLTIETIGDNPQIIEGVVYNPYWATGEAANRLKLPTGKSLALGTRYKVSPIHTSKVDSGYFSVFIFINPCTTNDVCISQSDFLAWCHSEILFRRIFHKIVSFYIKCL